MNQPACQTSDRGRRGAPGQAFLSFAGAGLAALFLLVACNNGNNDGGVINPGGGGGASALNIQGGQATQGFMTIDGLDINEMGQMVVTFSLSDGGNPLTLADLDSDPRFMHAWIVEDATTGLSKYQSYIFRTQDGQPFTFNGMPMQPALATTQQVSTDSGGTMEDLGGGSFRYTFATMLPAGYPVDATHTVAAYATRDGRDVVSNTYVHFSPSNAPVTLSRDIVTTETCNACHDTLAFHGGTRREMVICQMCHTDQTFDPESGASVDFGPMIHKIHNGVNLTNPYFVVGFGGSIHDYSDVVFPQDVRNCTVCHTGGTESDHWKEKPSRASCGSCHDDVDFATGANHGTAMVVQQTDEGCTICHGANLGAEFDQSVPGAHVVPYQSSANPGLTFQITQVVNMMPGMQPTVSFTISDNNGPVDIATLNRVAILFAGDTLDYTNTVSTDHSFTIQGGGSTGMLMANGIGDYSYVPFRDAGNTDAYTIPVNATGTWSVGMEARTESITAGPDSIRFGANNPVVHVDLVAGMLGMGNPTPRRTVVTDARCGTCHGDLVFHGNLRTDIEYCVMCHNRWTTDEGRRPGVDPVTNPPAVADFMTMIHKIHMGEDLENGYSIYGFGSTLHDYSEVVFPGNMLTCSQCHEGGSSDFPVPATNEPTVLNIAGVPLTSVGAILPPTTAACVSCHDGNSTLAHALTNITPNPLTDPNLWFEGCNTCHGPGAAFDVANAHAGN